ncbi:hypothetical protein AAG906_003099 [Vitis piasezkii]
MRKELPPRMLLVDVVLRTNLFPLQHRVQRRGAILEVLFRISEGYYFDPHHLIMASLLHFEEKVHKRRLHEATPFLLFPLLCHVLAHMGFPADPHSETRRHCIAPSAFPRTSRAKGSSSTALTIYICSVHFSSIEPAGDRPDAPPVVPPAPAAHYYPAAVSGLARFSTLDHYSTAIMERIDHFRQANRLSFYVRFSKTSVFCHQLHLFLLCPQSLLLQLMILI